MSWKQAALYDEAPLEVGASSNDAGTATQNAASSSGSKQRRTSSWKKVALDDEMQEPPPPNRMVDWKRASLQEDEHMRPLKKNKTGKSWKTLSLLDEGRRICSDEEDVEEEQEQTEIVTVHLSLPLLRMLPVDERLSLTTYAQNGMNADRIKDVCSSGCRCQKQCLQHFSVRQAKAFNSTWHQLSRETQVQVLNQLFNPNEKLEDLKTESSGIVRSSLDLD